MVSEVNRRKLIISVVLLSVAAGVRLIVWQNNAATMSMVQSVVTAGYLRDSGFLLKGDLHTFVYGEDPPSDANILAHPPGYPIILAAVQAAFGSASVHVVQILISSLAPVLMFLIGSALFGTRVGVTAGALGALSPQFAYYSGLILPDDLCVLPILASLWVLVLARERPQWQLAVICGIALGLSCWLRSNALLLPVFVCLGVLLTRGMSSRFALVILASFLMTIAPITLRNAFVFGSFVPLSVGSGTTFIEGLGDLDTDGSKGYPKLDEEVMMLDVERLGRPDYYGYLYAPDGILGERERVGYGLSAVAGHPGWFFKGAAGRGMLIWRLERVPVIARERMGEAAPGSLAAVLNIPLRLIQSAFITAVFLPLILLGIGIVLYDREKRGSFWLLAAVPFYYMTVQPLVHTEYRYLLPASHVLLIFAAVGIVFVWSWIAGKIASNRDGLAAAE